MSSSGATPAPSKTTGGAAAGEGNGKVVDFGSSGLFGPGGPTDPLRGSSAGGTDARAVANQARIAQREKKSVVTAGRGLFSAYKPTGARALYADAKVGIMPDLEGCIQAIADAAGVDLGNEDDSSRFVEALVIDVFVNAYSDKQSFEGDIVVGSYALRREYIRMVIQERVGTQFRRYARAMAPLVVQIFRENPEAFGDILDKRATELGLGSRSEAMLQFDGADALTNVDRSAAETNAAAKHLALTYRNSHKSYNLSNSAKSVGDHSVNGTPTGGEGMFAHA